MTEGKITDRRIIHGVLVAVLNRGTLICGASGTGKSELALELISRGHRLVADDAVCIFRRGKDLFGEAPELTAGILQIEALGFVDVEKVFGPRSLQVDTKIEVCIDLLSDPTGTDCDPLSASRSIKEFLGVAVPLVRLNVSRRWAEPVIVETAVRMLEHPSANVARRVAADHDSSIIHSSPIPQ